MDEQLLAELYGIDPNEQADYEADDSLIKEAQAELVEAVADEAGIDLDEMDDDELEKFASYVLSAEGGEDADSYVDDDMYAQADEMGRVMAHAYADEQMKIASYMDDDFDDFGYENALEKSAAAWDMMKVAKTTGEFREMGNRDFKNLSNYEKRLIAGRRFGKDVDTKRTLADAGVRKRDYLRALVGRGTGFYDIQSARQIGKSLREGRSSMTKDELKAMDRLRRSKEVRDLTKSMTAKELEALDASLLSRGGSTRTIPGFSAFTTDQADALLQNRAAKVRRGLMMRGAGKAGLTAAGLGALGYGAHRAMNR